MSPIEKLAEVLSELQGAGELPSGAIAPLLVQLAAVQTALAARLITAEPMNGDLREDQLLTAEEAAARMAVSVNYLYKHCSKLPFTIRQGRLVRFSSIGLNRYLEKRRGR